MNYLSLYIESAPYPNTLPTRQPIRIEHYVTPSPLGSQSKSSITSPESSANQNRVIRNPSRHPRSLGSAGGLFSALGSSRLAIAYLNTSGTSGPPTTTAHTLTTCICFFKTIFFHKKLQFTQKLKLKF